MTNNSVTRHQIEQIYRAQSRRVLATLIRLLNDFSLAEECLQEAFIAALDQWPRSGLPDHPAAWLISTGHRRGIDHIRRQQTARRHAPWLTSEEALAFDLDDAAIEDDLLRLLFTCCHPALATQTRVALTLREMCGLSTEQIARALPLTPVGPYTLQGSIAAEHATAPSASQTNWKRIVALYDALYRQQPSAVITLNRAVAIAMRDSPAAGLQELDRLNVRAVINFHLYHAARADLLRRTGDIGGARQAYQRALSLATQEPERRFLARQLEHLEAPDDRSSE